jgi:hypothetical protein
MRTIMTAILILATAPAFAQQIEHAPSVDQCQADQRLWLHRVEDKDDKLLDITFGMLSEWYAEMDRCQAVDPPNSHRYYNTQAEIQAEKLVRFQSFVERHGLLAQFFAEDTAGKR